MSKTASRRAGFTLIEVLVALVIIALLVAAVFPSLTRQIDDAEPTRLANDLANIRTGLETFQVNVRETPSDLEDLTNVITADTDLIIDGTTFEAKHVNRWKGPYLDASLAVAAGTATGTAITSGFSAAVQNDLIRCNSTSAAACTETTPNFAALKLTNLTVAEWSTINDLIDGENETATATAGKWRATVSGSDVTTAYYYAVPITN